jgi:hypothetical protein
LSYLDYALTPLLEGKFSKVLARNVTVLYRSSVTLSREKLKIRVEFRWNNQTRQKIIKEMIRSNPKIYCYENTLGLLKATFAQSCIVLSSFILFYPIL